MESPERVAEEFNEYFCSVFGVEDLGSIPEADEGPDAGGLIDMVISSEKVRELLRKLRVGVLG